MAGDLVGGSWPVTYPFRKLTGLAGLVAQSNVSVRSNAEWLGIAGLTDGALAATGVGCVVAVPVETGDTISRVSILVGATAGVTMTNQFAAIYSGTTTPTLLGQSTDTTSAAIAASGLAGWSLAAAQTVTSTNAPFGYVYALIAITAATIPTAAVASTPAAVGYKWFPNGPAFLSATAGSALAGAAPATLPAATAKAVAPLVFLS